MIQILLALARAYWKPLAVAAVLLAVAAGIGWWGHGRYEQGRADERAEAKLAQIAIEQGMQYEADRADAEYRGRIMATEVAQKDLSARLADAGGMLRDLRRKLQTAGTCGRLDDTGGDWIGILGASWAEYTDMAADAARLADKVGGLQAYIRGIRKR